MAVTSLIGSRLSGSKFLSDMKRQLAQFCVGCTCYMHIIHCKQA